MKGIARVILKTSPLNNKVVAKVAFRAFLSFILAHLEEAVMAFAAGDKQDT